MKKYFVFLSFIFLSVSTAFASGDFATPRPKNVIDLKTLPNGTYPITYPNGGDDWPAIQYRLLPDGKKTFTVLLVLWHFNWSDETVETILGEVGAHEIEWRDTKTNSNIKAIHFEIKDGKVIYWHPDAKKRKEFYCTYKMIAQRPC